MSIPSGLILGRKSAKIVSNAIVKVPNFSAKIFTVRPCSFKNSCIPKMDENDKLLKLHQKGDTKLN